jgi:hypothetical protein
MMDSTGSLIIVQIIIIIIIIIPRVIHTMMLYTHTHFSVSVPFLYNYPLSRLVCNSKCSYFFIYSAVLKRLATPSDFHIPLPSIVPFAHSETSFTHCSYFLKCHNSPIQQRLA